jgi:hypothetical protein
MARPRSGIASSHTACPAPGRLRRNSCRRAVIVDVDLIVDPGRLEVTAAKRNVDVAPTVDLDRLNDKVVEVNDCVKAAATLARRWASSSATIFTTSAILFEVLCGVHAATGLGVLERAVQ